MEEKNRSYINEITKLNMNNSIYLRNNSNDFKKKAYKFLKFLKELILFSFTCLIIVTFFLNNNLFKKIKINILNKKDFFFNKINDYKKIDYKKELKKTIYNKANINLKKNYSKLINESFGKKIIINAANNYLKKKFKKEIDFLQDCLNNIEIENFEKYDNPKLSIIIPFYNSEKYLNRLLRSIQKQELKELEIIFVDDCSKDQGPLLLEKYSKIDKRIVIIKNIINKGNLYTYVNGILNAKSKFILIIDSDDMLLSKLKQQYELSEKNNKDINDFSFLKGSISMIKQEIIIKDSERYQPELGELCFSGIYPCPCFITKKIIKTEIAQKAVRSLNEKHLNSHILIYADITLFIAIFSYSQSYKSFSDSFNQIYIDNQNSITKPYVTKYNKLFIDALYLSEYVYNLKYKSIKKFNKRILYIIKQFKRPLNLCKSNKLEINNKHLYKIFNKFLNNKKISKENKKKIRSLLKIIEKKIKN